MAFPPAQWEVALLVKLLVAVTGAFAGSLGLYEIANPTDQPSPYSIEVISADCLFEPPKLKIFQYNVLMPETLLQTKLFIPPMRPNLVPRPQLIERLNQGLQLGHKLSLISAPAGFGKTTLASEWVSTLRADGFAQRENRIAWLSLDENDNDPTRFLAYVIAALSQAEGNEAAFGQGALGMLQSAQPPPIHSTLGQLINELASIPGKTILILDDLHIIESTQVDDALAFLVEYLPPQTFFVIVTRDDPRLPLARLRAHGQLTELRAADLRFSSSEAAGFLNEMMGLGLSEEDIAALESRTEGWIAGLQLAAISLQGRPDATGLIQSFSGSHRFVLDYLIEEVLDQQPESVQKFLLQTAILNRLTGSLCDALTGQDDGRVALETLEHTNLFIVPLDQDRRWYRYHHLFSDLIRQRLRQTQPDWVPLLHQRASEWHEQNAFTNEAIEHAFLAKDFERAARLVEDNVDEYWQRGEHNKLRRWLDRLPADLSCSSPDLCILRAWDLFTNGQQEAAEQSLDEAESLLVTDGDLPPGSLPGRHDRSNGLYRMKIQGRAAAVRAFLAFYRGDVPGIHHYAQQALEYLPEGDLTWRSTVMVALGDAYAFAGQLAEAYQIRLEALEACEAAGNIYMTLIASMKLAVILRRMGRLQRVNEICHEQRQLAYDSGLSGTAVVGWILAIWGEVLAELNQLDLAIERTKKGVELAQLGNDMSMIGWSNICLVRVLFSSGDIPGAEEILQEMESIARSQLVPPWIMNLLAVWRVRIWLAQGDVTAAARWAQEQGFHADDKLSYQREVNHITLARLFIAQGEVDVAAGLLQRLLEAADTGGRVASVIEILMLQALTLQARQDTDQAIATLKKAFELAEPEGFVRLFVDEGPAMAGLIKEISARGMSGDHVRRLRAAFTVDGPAQPTPSPSGASETALVEPLTERELEVLQRIAGGLTNSEIAARLFLSLNTIKVHTRNIYGKLDVHNRTEAVARARALGILPRD